MTDRKTKSLPPMQAFAVDLMASRPDEWLSPHTLKVAWRDHNNRPQRCASRDSFGATSAAYRTFRKLEEMGVAECKNFGAWRWYDFRYKLTVCV